MRKIPLTEDISIEFKSDRKCLPDNELVEAIVCLANADGGVLFLGVEKDGTITGVHDRHRDCTGLPGLIANRTSPPLHVTAELIEQDGVHVAKVTVPQSRSIVATSDGRVLRRRLDQNGEPLCQPLMPHEFARRMAHFGAYDFTGQTVPDLTEDALDPLERERLRRTVQSNTFADKPLLKLSDDDLVAALELIRLEDGVRRPTVAGLLLVGREDVLARHLPQHELAFQAMRGTKVLVNEFYRWPLIRLQEQLDAYYRAHAVEQEVQFGLFRVAIPNVDAVGYREAVLNALAHRDYTQRGQIYIQWHEDQLSVSSPGGLLEGVTPANILSVPPKPRNPTLAAALKRIGLVERTGRGVDLIYEGLVKYGRPFPSYARSGSMTVIVDISAADANLKFVGALTVAQNRRGESFSLHALMVMNMLQARRRVSAAQIVEELPMLPPATVRSELERLLEAGLLESHGTGKGRTYTLSSAMYADAGRKADYVRQTGISRQKHNAMVLEHVAKFDRISRKEVIELLNLSDDQASRLLEKLVKSGDLVPHGEKRGRYYTAGVRG